MKFFFTSQSSKHLAHDKSNFITPQLEQQIRDEPPIFTIPKSDTPKKIVCEYHPYCKAQAGHINCLTQQQECASYKFYSRWGVDWLENMGIGAMI